MRRQLAKLLSKLKTHWTLLVVSHDPGELLPIADRCWKIERGDLHPVDPATLLAHSQD
jgi:energy-coupling factor transport system ATP-binding protein